MRRKIFIALSVILHFIFMILFLNDYMNMDIMYLLGFCYVPILISLILCSIDTYLNKRNYSIGFSIVNILYLISANIFITKSDAADLIYKNSQKYSSSNVAISIDSSPTLSLIIFIIVSLTLHILISKFIFKSKLSKGSI